MAARGDVGDMGALAAWRITQGIYRFDPGVYDAVHHTPLKRDIPCDILYRLPEWCVYIETPGFQSELGEIYGAFAHLEWDVNTARVELRLVIDCDDGLIPLPLHLGPWSLREALDRTMAESLRQAALMGLAEVLQTGDEFRARILSFATPLVSLLLYLCSQAAEIGDGKKAPHNPRPKRVHGVPRFFPAEKPTTWNVGMRLGAALRRAYAAAEAGNDDKGGTHASPRPHIRRAHWHGFWSGPIEDGPGRETVKRRFELRWLPPISVNVDDVGEMPAVFRTVK